MALKMVAVRIFLLLAVLYSARASGFCKHVVEPLGYGCAEFTVQTSDGFVLALHRLSKSNSLTGNRGARSPAGTPVSSPTGDRNVSEARGPAPSPVILRINSSIYNSTMLTVELNASAHIQSPMPASEIRENSSQHSNPANASIQEGRLPYSSTRPSSQSTSLNKTSSNHNSELPAASPGPAPTGTHRSTSTHSERTTGNGSPSNYTVYPGVRTNSLIPIAFHFEINEFIGRLEILSHEDIALGRT